MINRISFLNSLTILHFMRYIASFFTLFFFLTIISFSRAQIRIDKYCLLINQTPMKSIEAKTSFKLYVGTEDSLFSFKDVTILTQLRKVEERTTLVDAFNYLSRLGWQYVSLSSLLNGGSGGLKTIIAQQYLFKRTFDSSELN